MSIHLSQTIKALIARQTFLARGFNKDVPEGKTLHDIQQARQLLARHVDHGRPRSKDASASSTGVAADSGAAKESWYIVVTALYTTLNYPAGLRLLWRTVDDALLFDARPREEGRDRDTAQARIHAAARMREAVLKCLPFLGVPRILGALSALTEVQRASIPQDAAPANDSTSIAAKAGADDAVDPNTLAAQRDPVWRALQHTRSAPLESLPAMQRIGRSLWDDVYSPASLAGRLVEKLQGWHPELGAYITTAAYGYALSPTDFIDRRETSMVAVTCLRGEEDVMAQLTSHVYGLIKAGCTEDAARAIIDVVDGIRSGTFVDHVDASEAA